MKGLLILCIVLITGIAILFGLYVKTTAEVIKSQEIEIGKLKREKRYLEKNREIVKVENITINKDPDYLPSYPSKEGF